MITSESTISQANYNCYLTIPSGFIRRASPELQEEIGDNPADLLLQLDYWIFNWGRERAGKRWLHMSATTISRKGFRTWSQRKVQRVIQALREMDLLQVEYFDGRYTTPYMTLNLPAIAKLKSVRPHEVFLSEGKTPAVPADAPPAAPAEKVAAGSGRSSAVPEVILYHTFTSTATMAGIVIGDEAIDSVDVPPSTPASIPPSTAATTPKEIQPESVPDKRLSEKKVKPKGRKEPKKRESARSADRAQRATPPANRKPQAEKKSPAEPTHSAAWEAFCRKLADLCAVDYEVNPGQVRFWASKIWKKGNVGQGYTVEDLDDFRVWWNTYDWRGAKNHTLPTPKQVVELLRQAYEHDSSQTRRALRANGVSPDESRYRYISGPLASYIRY